MFLKPDWVIKKRLYTPFPQAVPKYPVIDHENCTFFQKGTCKACRNSVPPVINFEQQDEIITIKVGNIILATGYDLFDAPEGTQLRLRSVWQMSSPAWNSNASPTQRDPLAAKSSSRWSYVPKSVGIIHCVGSSRQELPQLLFCHLLHAEPQIFPPC